MAVEREGQGSERLRAAVQRVAELALLDRRVSEAAPGLTAGRLAAALRVEPLGPSTYEIAFEHPDPRATALVASTIARLLQSDGAATSGEGETARDAQPRERPLPIRLLREAPVPTTPAQRPRWIITLAGALLGIALGLALAAVAELRDDRVKGPEDLDGILPVPVPVLSIIPELRGRDDGPE